MMAPALDTTAREAIAWMVLLHSGDASPQEQQALEHWLQRDARHRAAWQHLTGPVKSVFQPVCALNASAPGQAQALADAMADAKARTQKRRRVLRGALALGGVSTGAGVVLQRFEPLQNRLADFHTATGQRQRFALTDGSSLLLNARSAADIDFTAERRAVRLRSGALIAYAQPDAQRPFCVLTAQGEVQALSTMQRSRLLVRQQEQACLVAALEQPLRIVPRNGPAQRLAAGETAWLTAEGTRPATEEALAAAAWESGRITVHDRPLGEVIAALRAYRTGFVRISPEAAALKVYGSYPLDDSAAALASIAETLPVAVHVHSGGWLVRIELA